jgi:hypothetical protein
VLITYGRDGKETGGADPELGAVDAPVAGQEQRREIHVR